MKAASVDGQVTLSLLWHFVKIKMLTPAAAAAAADDFNVSDEKKKSGCELVNLVN